MDDAPPLLRTLKNVRFAAQPVLYNEGSSFARSCDFGMATFTNACLPSRSPYGLAFTRSLDGRTDAAPLGPWDTTAAQPQESALSGGFGTVYKGNFNDKTVAIKRVTTSAAAASSSSSTLSREIDILRNLSHPNVLPYYYGAEIYDGGVMPWAENRRIDSYLRRNAEVNRLEILQSIAEGLHYLHANNVIHGDLKPANILISDGGVPQLSNFGLSNDASLLEMNGSPEEMGSIRYMAPELVLYQEKPTKASDVFSWASTCYEILTSVMPYASTMSTSDIILAFYSEEAPYDGMKPLVNGHLNGLAIWGLMVASWVMDPGLRPNMQTILVNLQKRLKASEGKIAHL